MGVYCCHPIYGMTVDMLSRQDVDLEPILWDDTYLPSTYVYRLTLVVWGANPLCLFN